MDFPIIDISKQSVQQFEAQCSRGHALRQVVWYRLARPAMVLGMWALAGVYMRWCLECHNAPENFLRPRSEVFNAFYQAPGNQLALGRRLMKEYKVQKLTNCTTCHR